MLKKKKRILLMWGWILLISGSCFSQQKEFTKGQYIITEAQTLEIVVHIWGEVKKPGEYIVPDNTNILGLISKAGGPTEFSDLSKVKLTRGEVGTLSDPHNGAGKRIMKINLKEYLEKEVTKPLPLLQPGDIVWVQRNKLYTWQTIFRIITPIAIIFQAWYYYSRSQD